VTQDEALKWVATVFEAPAGSLTADTPQSDIPGWDSLGVLTMMADLDEKFKIQLDEGDVKAMTRVSDILALLQKHGALAA
jgi:acyl carrier protein